jgi:hypothetical protein
MASSGEMGFDIWGSRQTKESLGALSGGSSISPAGGNGPWEWIQEQELEDAEQELGIYSVHVVFNGQEKTLICSHQVAWKESEAILRAAFRINSSITGVQAEDGSIFPLSLLQTAPSHFLGSSYDLILAFDDGLNDSEHRD